MKDWGKRGDVLDLGKQKEATTEARGGKERK